VLFCCLTLTVLFALLWIKEDITERMAAEFQGDLTHESILQVLDCNNELVGDENTLTASGMALLLFIVIDFLVLHFKLFCPNLKNICDLRAMYELRLNMH